MTYHSLFLFKYEYRSHTVEVLLGLKGMYMKFIFELKCFTNIKPQ